MNLLYLLITWWLTWTAPGDDGMVGRASGSILQVSRDSLFAFPDTISTPLPSPSGMKDSTVYSSFWDTSYVRIFHFDEVGNLSGPSNRLLLLEPDPLLPILDLQIIGPSGSSKGVGFSYTVPDTEVVNYWIREFENGLPFAKRMWKWPGFTEDYNPSRTPGTRDTFVLSISAAGPKELVYLLYRERVSDGVSSRSSNRTKLFTAIDTLSNRAFATTSDTTWRAWIDKGSSWNEPDLGKIAAFKHTIYDTTQVSLFTWRDIQLRYFQEIFRIYGYVFLP